MGKGECVTDDSSCGQLLWSAKPFSIGIREGLTVNASFPFPRSLKIYDQGLLLKSLGTTVFVRRMDIESIRRGPGYVRISWGSGDHQSSAVINDLARISRTVAAMRAAGFSVEEHRPKTVS